MPIRLTVETFRTPIGDMLLAADRDGFLRATDYVGCEDRLDRLLARRLGRDGFSLGPGAAPAAITDAMRAYFAGEIAALGADGALTGYSGGTERKRWLLDHEARHAASA